MRRSLKMGLIRPGSVSCALMSLTLALCARTQAQQLEYGVRAGARYSDNVQRTATDEIGTGAGAVGLDLRGERTTGRFRYGLNGDVEYRDYFEEEVESQVFGRLSLDSIYAFVPDRFEWMLSGAFNQWREELLIPLTPDNIENVVTLSTGPRLRLRFGDFLDGLVEGRATTANYSEQTSDSDTLGGLVTLGRAFSETGFIGAGASYDEVTYDSPPGTVNPDFERHEYFLRFRTEGSRTQIDADAGWAEVIGSTFEDDGPMMRLRATRRMTPYLSAFLGLVKEYPTSASTVVGAGASPDFDPADDASVLTTAPRQSESAEVGLNMSRPRTSAQISYVMRYEKQVVAVPIERDVDEVRASITRRIAERSSVRLFGTYTQEEIPGSAAEFDEGVYGGELDLALGRALSLAVFIEYRDRDSSSATDSYAELASGLFLRYGNAARFGMLRSARP